LSNLPTPPPIPTPHLVEERFPGIVAEWFSDKKIVAYRLTAVSQAVINNWEKLVLQVMNEWDKDQPYLALHDVSGTGISLQYATLVGFDLMNIGITALGRDLGEEMFNKFPQFRARVAIGFNLSVSGQVSQVVMDRIKMKHPSITYKTFFNRDRSLTWLMDALKPKIDNPADQTQELINNAPLPPKTNGDAVV